MKNILKSFFIFILILSILNVFNVSAKVSGKNNFELLKDQDFTDAVKLVINDYYHKGDVGLANSIKSIIVQYCYVDNNKIKCK